MKSLLITLLLILNVYNSSAQCNHTIELTDTYGDGWNGGAVTVSVNGTAVLTDITIAAGFGPDIQIFTASTGDVINVTRTIDGSYSYEMRIEVKDLSSNTIISLQEPPVAPGVDGVGNCTLSPMTYVSSTTTQLNTGIVAPSSTSQEIIGIEIVTTGNSSPIDMTQLLLRTNGTTNITDISNAKLWYTGTSNIFATTTQFGATVASPPNVNIDMPFSATQTLAEGTNYFWLTYDIQAGATLGNLIDGIFQEVTINASNYSPTVSTPVGSREIIISYCSSNATNTGDSEIDEIILSGNTITINNNTASVCADYSDFTAQAPAELSIGSTYQIDVTAGTCGGNYEKGVRVFIDWNQDGDFDDTDETIGDAGPNSATTQYNIPIIVPAGATIGDTRMRVIVQETATPSGILSCGTYAYGETEDYTINVSAPTVMTYVSCTASQPNTDIVSAGYTNQEIIRLEVVTSGTLSPIDATELIIRTDGSDNFLTDIVDAKIWYTGTSDVFTTSTQFGTTLTPLASGNDMIFTSTQTLSSGTNYFWLTYSIPPGATNGNNIDGKFQSIIVDGITRTPTIAEPTGDRLIVQGCYHTITLYDQGGNGWEGGTITVQVNGVDVLTNVTLAAGSSTDFTFIADNGENIETFYSPGTNSSENRYEITNPNGKYILSDGHDNEIPSAGLIGTGDCDGVPSFTINGDSYNSGSDCIILTEDKATQSGSVWYNYKVDLSNDFQIDFDIYLGDKDITFVNPGADGVTFTMQGECAASGGNGASLGYGGITSSIAVEFDTYQNSIDMNDPVADHIAIISNGDVNHLAATSLASPIDIAAGFEDDAWHSASIIWSSASQNFEVYFDGSMITSYSGDIVTDIFGGNSNVFWGFTGGTGLFFNRQEICITNYPANSSALTDISCDPCNEQIEVAQGATSYSWTPNDGSIDNPTIYNPTFSPIVTTEYTVVIEDGCGNLIEDVFTVFVGSFLPVDLLKFEAKCNDKFIDIIWTTTSESNNDYFVVEKSYDAIDFFEVGEIKGSGNSNSIQKYKWKDTEKISKTVYYRLKQIDFNGKYQYYETISTNCKSEDVNVMIYPNPAIDQLNILLESCEKLDYKFELYNSVGQKIKNGVITNNRTTININSVPKGIYIIVIESNDDIHKERIIIE